MESQHLLAPNAAEIEVCRRFESRTYARSRGRCRQPCSQLNVDGATRCSTKLIVQHTAAHGRASTAASITPLA